MHTLFVYFFFGLSIIGAINAQCIPKPANFVWKNFCPISGKVDNPKIIIKDVKAYQDNKLITSGLHPNKILTMNLSIDYRYGREINNNLFDFKFYHFMDSGEGCKWEYEDLGDFSNNINGCTIVKGDCRYTGNPKRVTAVIDLKKLFGKVPIADLTVAGDYYGFEITQRDGSQKLNCFWMQNKLLDQ